MSAVTGVGQFSCRAPPPLFGAGSLLLEGAEWQRPPGRGQGLAWSAVPSVAVGVCAGGWGSVLLGSGLAQPQRPRGMLQGHVERSRTFPPLLGGGSAPTKLPPLPFWELGFSEVQAGLRAWGPAAQPQPGGPQDSWSGPAAAVALARATDPFAGGEVASDSGGLAPEAQGLCGAVPVLRLASPRSSWELHVLGGLGTVPGGLGAGHLPAGRVCPDSSTPGAASGSVRAAPDVASPVVSGSFELLHPLGWWKACGVSWGQVRWTDNRAPGRQVGGRWLAGPHL